MSEAECGCIHVCYLSVGTEAGRLLSSLQACQPSTRCTEIQRLKEVRQRQTPSGDPLPLLASKCSPAQPHPCTTLPPRVELALLLSTNISDDPRAPGQDAHSYHSLQRKKLRPRHGLSDNSSLTFQSFGLCNCGK